MGASQSLLEDQEHDGGHPEGKDEFDFAASIGFDGCCGHPFCPSGREKKDHPDTFSKVRALNKTTAQQACELRESSFRPIASQPSKLRLGVNQRKSQASKNYLRFDTDLNPGAPTASVTPSRMQNIAVSKSAAFENLSAAHSFQSHTPSKVPEMQDAGALLCKAANTPVVEAMSTPPPRQDVHTRGLAWTPDSAAVLIKQKAVTDDLEAPASSDSNDSLPVPKKQLRLYNDENSSPRPGIGGGIFGFNHKEGTMSPKYVSSRPSPKHRGLSTLAAARNRANAQGGFGSPQATYVSSRPTWQAFQTGKENGSRFTT